MTLRSFIVWPDFFSGLNINLNKPIFYETSFRMRTAIALIFALSALAFLPSCYNDDDLWDSVDDLDNRVTDIESQLKSINSDIATLRALVDGVQQELSSQPAPKLRMAGK